ncbi:MAG: anti-sigma regulatory factor [Polyangiaceae bacterium]|nr:anti-sigma regulatory factor [Polyangiaceae bacterium]
MIDVVAQYRLEIQIEDDIVIVRRKARQLAQARKLDPFATAAITTAVSELTRNVLVHAGGGSVVLEEISDGERYGVRATFEDHGPGIANLELALAGGHSTSKTMGLGLSGSKRLADRFEVKTEKGVGTTVRIEKWQGL